MNVASSIEQTLLRPNTTPEQIDELCSQALQFGFAGVCVNPCYVPQAAKLVGGRCAVVSVVGFPLGAGSESSDIAEACWVVEQGATEVDMVVPLGAAAAGDWHVVTERVKAVRRATEGAVLKVILETGYFDPSQLAELARAVIDAEPDYLKTSTGFGPKGAVVEEVELLARLAPQGCRVKASGGIRSLDQAQVMLGAGASRLGTSSGHLIVAGAGG